MQEIINFLTNVTLIHYLIFALVLFLTALAGVLLCKNVIKVLILVEIMFNAAALNFVTFAGYLDPAAKGMTFALFIMGISAAQLAVAIAFLYALYKYKKSVDLESYKELNG